MGDGDEEQPFCTIDIGLAIRTHTLVLVWYG